MWFCFLKMFLRKKQMKFWPLSLDSLKNHERRSQQNRELEALYSAALIALFRESFSHRSSGFSRFLHSFQDIFAQITSNNFHFPLRKRMMNSTPRKNQSIYMPNHTP